MKKRLSMAGLLFCLILVSLGLTGCGESLTFIPYCTDDSLASINIVDQNGISEIISNPERLKQYENVDFLSCQPYKKVLRVYSRDDQGNIRAYVTSYHPNGQPKQYLEVLNGRAFGCYKEWHPNGKIKVQANITGGEADLTLGAEKTWLFEGNCRAWDDNGRLEADIPYSKGDLEGISYYYHTNGNVWRKIPYTKNKAEGVEEIFLETGGLFQTVTYSKGLKNGPSQRFWRDGRIAADEAYCDGKLTWGRYFDNCGKVISSINDGIGFRSVFGKENLTELHEYQGGVQQGVVKVLDKNGKLLKTYSIQNNLKHGEEVSYYPAADPQQNPKPQLSITWSNGKIQGAVKTWYPSGIQESQREMTKNTKNGILMAWYVDGSLMMIEEYDHDKLVKGEYYKRGDKNPVSYVKDGRGTANIFDKDGVFLRKVNYHHGFPEKEI